jgi:DNA-binding response OmpR family regulator
MFADLLDSAGYRSLLLARGKDAHVAIRNAKPDLVILDLWLEHPDAGGTVLGLLGLDPGTRHIPVIVCSAHVDVLRDRAPELRRYGYVLLEKPFQAKELLAAIESLLARVGNRGGPEHG